MEIVVNSINNYQNSQVHTFCLDSHLNSWFMYSTSCSTSPLRYLIETSNYASLIWAPNLLPTPNQAFSSYRFSLLLMETPWTPYIISATGVYYSFPMSSKNVWQKLSWGLPWWLSGKESTWQCGRHRLHPWSGKIAHATEQLSPHTTTIEPVL